MNKIYYIAFCLIAVILSSCDNKSIDIEETKVIHYYDMNVNTKTYQIYDNYEGTAKTLAKMDLASHKQISLGVSTLLYNSNGEFVDSVCSYHRSLDQLVEHSFNNMAEGDYTIVTIETIVESYNDYKSPIWDIKDIEKISTLKILAKNIANVEGIIGADCIEVSFHDNQQFQTEPKALGSLIYLMNEGFSESDIQDISLYAKGNAIGYLFDPKLSHQERMIFDESSDWKRIGYCLGTSDHTIPSNCWFVIGSNLNWCFGIKTDKNTDEFIPLSNENQYYKIEQGVSYYSYIRNNEKNGGDVFFGSLSEKNTWYESLPPIALFIEPYHEWGASVSDVQNYMSKYKIKAGNTTAIQAGENAFVYWYYPKYREAETDYYFTSETTGLFVSYVFFDVTQVGEDEILAYYKDSEQFIYYGINVDFQDNVHYFSTVDKKTAIGIYNGGQGAWVVQYYPNSANEESSASTRSLEPKGRIKKALKTILRNKH